MKRISFFTFCMMALSLCGFAQFRYTVTNPNPPGGCSYNVTAQIQVTGKVNYPVQQTYLIPPGTTAVFDFGGPAPRCYYGPVQFTADGVYGTFNATTSVNVPGSCIPNNAHNNYFTRWIVTGQNTFQLGQSVVVH